MADTQYSHRKKDKRKKGGTAVRTREKEIFFFSLFSFFWFFSLPDNLLAKKCQMNVGNVRGVWRNTISLILYSLSLRHFSHDLPKFGET